MPLRSLRRDGSCPDSVACPFSAGFPGRISANGRDKTAGAFWWPETIESILIGRSKPVHVLQSEAEVKEIVNIAAVNVVDAQETEERLKPEPNSSPKALSSKEEQTLPLETQRR